MGLNLSSFSMQPPGAPFFAPGKTWGPQSRVLPRRARACLAVPLSRESEWREDRHPSRDTDSGRNAVLPPDPAGGPPQDVFCRRIILQTKCIYSLSWALLCNPDDTEA